MRRLSRITEQFGYSEGHKTPRCTLFCVNRLRVLVLFMSRTSLRNLSLICKLQLSSPKLLKDLTNTQCKLSNRHHSSLFHYLTPFILAKRQLLVVGGNNLPKAKTKFINHRHRASQFRARHLYDVWTRYVCIFV